MILTPFVLRNISFLANLLAKENEVEQSDNEKGKLKDHVVVLGYGRLGRRICDKLESRGVTYIAIESNIQNVKEAQKEGKPVIFGNASKKSILESTNILEASATIVAFDNSEKLHLVCDILKSMRIDTPIIIKVDRFIEKELLQKEFPHYQIVVGTEQVARGMVDSMLKCELN
jgi:CPA2 family monovalent cation:H+ antiporter-2